MELALCKTFLSGFPKSKLRFERFLGPLEASSCSKKSKLSVEEKEKEEKNIVTVRI